jgi:formylglycine-generating enzyme required for sulfatase activity
VADSGYEPQDRDSLEGVLNHPVVYVTWYDALAYCDWLGGRLRALAPEYAGRAGNPATSVFWQGIARKELVVSLPSEAEWEKAARGDNGRIYPWGDKFDPVLANTSEIGLGRTSPVGCFPGGASPYGVLDMAGNVWEWTRSLWGKNFSKPEYKYPYDPDDGREDLGLRDLRVLRGGSFDYFRRLARCAYRDRHDPDHRFDYRGFRAAVVGL